MRTIPRRPFAAVLAGLLLAAGAETVPAAETGPGPRALGAPYQIDGLIRLRGALYQETDGVHAGPPLILVYLGDAEGKPHPGSERHRAMTIIGTRGTAKAHLVDIEKHCLFLCGEEGEGCTYVGLYRLEPGAERIGAPVAAVSGHHAFEGFTPAAQGALPAPGSAALAALAAGGPAWVPGRNSGAGVRVSGWDGSGGEAMLQVSESGGGFEQKGLQCVAANQGGGLMALNCSGFSLLFADDGPVAVSFGDYNRPLVQVLARFRLGDTEYAAVNLGLKAQDAVALVMRTESGWRVLMRPRDGALLC